MGGSHHQWPVKFWRPQGLPGPATLQDFHLLSRGFSEELSPGSQLFFCCCDKKETLTKSNSEIEELLWAAGTREVCVCHGAEVWLQVAGVAAGVQEAEQMLLQQQAQSRENKLEVTRDFLFPPNLPSDALPPGDHAI